MPGPLLEWVENQRRYLESSISLIQQGYLFTYEVEGCRKVETTQVTLAKYSDFLHKLNRLIPADSDPMSDQPRPD